MHALRMFTLLEPLESGKSARARLFTWNGEQYIPEKQVIRVYDYIGEFGRADDRGYCFFSESSKRWEVACGLFSQSHQPAL